MNTTLLIVDDEEDIREMLSRHFRYLGYDVDTACNGKDALDKLAQKKVDILISDIMMPELNGVELLRNVRNDYPMVRPIMITGYVTMDNALACMRYGADKCIFKPLSDLSLLEKAVEESREHIHYWKGVLKELKGMK
jgi:CheY-like chemotaxis protein